MAELNLQIAASTDDAQELTGTVVVDGLSLNANTTTQHTGLRFIVPTEKIAEVRGSIVHTTNLDLFFVSGSLDDPDVTGWGEDANAGAAFATSTNNVSARTPTSATWGWDVAGLGTGWETTPDFAPVVQEIVSRPDWSGVIVIIYKGDDNNSAIRIRSWDGNSSEAATLNFTYTPVTALTVAGLPSDESFGQAEVSAALDLALTVASLLSDEAIGGAALETLLAAVGLTSDEAFGTAAVEPLAAPLTAVGLVSDEAIGGAALSAGTAPLTAAGLASDEAFGPAAVEPLAAPLTAAGLASDEAFGTAVVTTIGSQVLSASGLPSDEAFGPAVMRVLLLETTISSNSEEATNGTVNTTSTSRNINPTSKYNAWHISNPALPADGVTFLDVRLQTRPFSFDDPVLKFYGDASNSPASLTTATNDISLRERTAAEVEWDEDNAGIEVFVDSPNLAAVFQEVYDAGGWVEGTSDFVLIAEDMGGAIRYYSGAEPNSSLRPKIRIAYSINEPHTLQASGLPSDEAIGSAALAADGVALTVEGLSSDEAIGQATVVVLLQALEAEGLASDEAIGGAAVVQEQFLAVAGLASDEALGTAVLSQDQQLQATGLPSDEVIAGAVVTAGGVGLTAAGLGSDEAIGGATVDLVILASGLESDETFGLAEVSGGDIGLAASGLVSDEAFGQASITAGAVGLTAAGLSSDEAIGGAAVGLVLPVVGLGSDEAIGGAAVAVGTATLAAAGLASDETFGQAVIGTGLIGLVVESLTSDEAIGGGTITLHLSAAGLASDEAIGAGNRVFRVFDNPGHAGQRAWWALDEAAGAATWVDVHAYGQHLTATGSIGSEAGKQNGAAVFEAANVEYLGRATTHFQNGGGSFSISGWYKPNSVAAGQRYLVANGSLASNRFEYGIRRNGNRLEFLRTTNGQAGTASILQNSVNLTVGAWHFFCATYNAATDTKTLMVNTTAASVGSISTVFSGSQEFYLAFLHNLTSNTLDGVLDEVNVWDVTLTSSNVSWLYNDGFGRTHDETGVVLFAGGLASDEAIGGAAVGVGVAALAAVGLAGDEAFGVAVLGVGSVVMTAVGLAGDEAFGQTVVISATTPDDRILLVAAEGRVYAVPVEGREYIVRAEHRVYEVLDVG